MIYTRKLEGENNQSRKTGGEDVLEENVILGGAWRDRLRNICGYEMRFWGSRAALDKREF